MVGFTTDPRAARSSYHCTLIQFFLGGPWMKKSWEHMGKHGKIWENMVTMGLGFWNGKTWAFDMVYMFYERGFQQQRWWFLMDISCGIWVEYAEDSWNWLIPSCVIKDGLSSNIPMNSAMIFLYRPFISNYSIPKINIDRAKDIGGWKMINH